MFKKLNLAIVALFAVAGASQAGVLNSQILTSWRQGLATRDVSGSNIRTALATAAANISSTTDAFDGNFIKDFVTNGNDGLNTAINNLTSLSKNDGEALVNAVNNFFVKVNSSFALSTPLKQFQRKWTDKIKKITATK